MPRRNPKLRIEDILESIIQVQQFIQGMDEESFGLDPRTIQAVAYNLLIIGEASSQLSADVREAYPELPWAEMRGLRNVIAHEYYVVRPAILWKTATENLPPLVPLLQTILAEKDPLDT